MIWPKNKAKSYDQDLFPKEFLAQFSSYKLFLKRKAGQEKEGTGKIERLGNSFDFLGYSPYTPGDDMRYIDWNIYARLDQLIVKKFMFSPCPNILILIDASASMSIGNPAKFQTACRIAALLGYLSQQNGHSIRFAFLQEKKIHCSPRFFYGQSCESMLSFLSWQKAQGKISLETTLLSLVSNLPKSYIFLCSDLLSAQNSKPALAQTRAKGHELSLFHLLAPEEISPPLQGQVRLKDIEGNAEKILCLNQETLDMYHKSLQIFQNQWSCFCLKHNIQYSFSSCYFSSEVFKKMRL